MTERNTEAPNLGYQFTFNEKKQQGLVLTPRSAVKKVNINLNESRQQNGRDSNLDSEVNYGQKKNTAIKMNNEKTYYF